MNVEKEKCSPMMQRVMQSVQGALRSCTRQAPSVAKIEGDNSQALKALDEFEKEAKKTGGEFEETAAGKSQKRD